MPFPGPWLDGFEAVEGVIGNTTRDHEYVNGPDTPAASSSWATLPLAQPTETQGFSPTYFIGMGPSCASHTYSGPTLASTASRQIKTLGFLIVPGTDIRDSTPPGAPPGAVGWEWESDAFTVTAEIVAADIHVGLSVDRFLSSIPDGSGATLSDTVRLWKLAEPAYTVDGSDVTWPSLDETDFSIATELAAFPHTYVTGVDGAASSIDTVDVSWDATGAGAWDDPSVHVIALTFDSGWSATDPFPTDFSSDILWDYSAVLQLFSGGGDFFGSGSKLKLRYSTPRYRWLFPGVPPLFGRGRDTTGLLARGSGPSVSPLLARSRIW